MQFFVISCSKKERSFFRTLTSKKYLFLPRLLLFHVTGWDCHQLVPPDFQLLFNSLQMFVWQVEAFVALEPESEHTVGAEISKVAVLVVNQGIKHQHTADLPGKLRPQLVIVGKAGGNAFPVLQVIIHGVQAHGFHNLRSIILTVRLLAHIGRTRRVALVTINPIILHSAPRL